MVAKTPTDIHPATVRKMEALRATLLGMPPVIIAYSGGVDSAFLAAVAHEVLGDKALAVTAKSPSLAPDELEAAVSLAEQLGVNHRVIETNELERDGYRANSPQRCYFCKAELYGHLTRIAEMEGFSSIANGINADDLGDFRPGLQAGKEHSVRTPLAEVGLTKEEIRSLSREMGLSTWDKPAQACLASRIPYGTPVSVETLGRIGKAEKFLRELGFAQLRVRHHEAVARIEVPPQDFCKFMDDGVRQQVARYFRSIGYAYVTLDLEGFRSGSLNRVLTSP